MNENILWSCVFIKAHWFYVMLESCKRCSSVNFYRFLYRFTQNLFTWKSTQLVFIILFIACRNWLWLIDQKFKESDTDFLEWKTRSFVLNLVPRMLKITFSGFQFSKFSGKASHPTPLPPQGLTCPFWYSRLLYSILLAISIFIETPDIIVEPQYNKHLDIMKSSV